MGREGGEQREGRKGPERHEGGREHGPEQAHGGIVPPRARGVCGKAAVRRTA